MASNNKNNTTSSFMSDNQTQNTKVPTNTKAISQNPTSQGHKRTVSGMNQVYQLPTLDFTSNSAKRAAPGQNLELLKPWGGSLDDFMVSHGMDPNDFYAHDDALYLIDEMLGVEPETPAVSIFEQHI